MSLKRELPKQCIHNNWIPAYFVSANIYIFWCSDCQTFILRDFNNLKEQK
jgi:hypothetical protein